MIKLRIFLLPSNRFLCQQRNIECEAFQFAIAIQTYDSKLIFRINPWLQPSRYWFKCRLQARILFLIYFDREMSIKLLFRSAFEKFFFHFPKEFSFSSLLKFFLFSFMCHQCDIFNMCLRCHVKLKSEILRKFQNCQRIWSWQKQKKSFHDFLLNFLPFFEMCRWLTEWLFSHDKRHWIIYRTSAMS